MKMLKRTILILLVLVTGGVQAGEEFPNVFRLKNRYYQSYLHTEQGKPRLKKYVPEAWWSARWTLEKVPNTKYYRLKCLYRNTYLHTEEDIASIIPNVNPSWHSAMWEVIEVPNTNFVWFKSRYKDYYLTTINGIPNVTSRIPRSVKSAHWRIEALSRFKKDFDCIEKTVDPIVYRNLCPSTSQGHLKSGNRNFDSKVETSVQVQLLSDSNKVTAQISLVMKATKNDTRVVAVWNKDVFTAPPGQAIRTINIGNRLSRTAKTLPEGGGEFMGCNDGNKHRLDFPNNSFVDYAIVIGDTGAEDISDDMDCNCDARLDAISLKSIEICLMDKRAYEQWIKENPVIIQ